MSSDENVELVRLIYELHERGEIDEALKLFAEDVVWVEPAENPDAQTSTGPEQARRSHDEWEATWGESKLEVRELIPAGERVLARLGMRVKGAGSGAPVEFEQFQVWTVRDGKIARMQMIYDEDEAKRAAGIEPTPIEETK